MQFTAAILAFAASVSAAQTTFTAQAVKSGSSVHFLPLQAAEGRISVGMEKQAASCDKKTDEAATFSLQGEELFLYKTDNPPQQIYVDASGMGQGILGYTTGAQPAPKNGDRKGWAVDTAGYLSYQERGFIACPDGYGSFSVWVNAGVDQPAGHENCENFMVRAISTEEPVGCLYTSN